MIFTLFHTKKNVFNKENATDPHGLAISRLLMASSGMENLLLILKERLLIQLHLV